MTRADVASPQHVFAFASRGALSGALMAILAEEDSREPQPGPNALDRSNIHDRSNALDQLHAFARDALSRTDDVIRDDDIQLSLFLLYALHYGSLPGLSSRHEWTPELIAVRGLLESVFEAQLRAEVQAPQVHVPQEHVPGPNADAVARALFAMTAPGPGPSVSRFVARTATVEQVRELLMHRSVYTLRESDPHSWVIPRLTGAPKAALMEIQFDEYGGGDPARVHATIFAGLMRSLGLDDTYGAYVDAVPAITLASLNLMSLFGLNRRLRGAIVGHLAAYEMTSSIPSKSYADGLRRLGFGAEVTHYYDEHVEADAVHEQIAGRDLAGALAEAEPELLDDILFGAAACITVEGWAGDHILQAWQAGSSSLRPSSMTGGTA